MLQSCKKPELRIKRLGEMLIEYIDNSQEDLRESRLMQPKRQIINFLFRKVKRGNSKEPKRTKRIINRKERAETE